MRTLSVVGDPNVPDGITAFAHRLAATLGTLSADHGMIRLDGQPGEVAVMLRALANYDAVVLHLPVVSWKRFVTLPLAILRAARRAGKATIVVLHEWSDLDWKRRASYLPMLPYVTRLVFSSPHVRSGFDADPLTRLATRHRTIIPIPPNLTPPKALPDTDLARRLVARRADVDVMIATFGSIYPKKTPEAVLDVAAALHRRGKRTALVFVGDFVRAGSADPEAAFRAAVAARGLTDGLIMTGHIEDAAELFAALAVPHVFVYRFAEGLTARRGSVLACVQAGRPVVVNAGASAHEFDHHALYRGLLAAGAIRLVPPPATADTMAGAVLAAAAVDPPPAIIDLRAAWLAAAQAVLAT
jgi:glycosyltransferase involved in cell wall biosynthesis